MSQFEFIQDFYIKHCNWTFKNHLDEESISIIYNLCLNNRIDEAKILTKECAFLAGLFYNRYFKINISLAIKYYLIALRYDPNDTFIIRQIATYYWIVEGKYSEMIKYYQMATDLGDTESMIELALFYQDHWKYEEMIKYFLMAVEHGNTEAMVCLANHYEHFGDYDNAIPYYKMAVRKGEQEAMIELTSHYERQENYYQMIKYLLMSCNYHLNDANQEKLLEYIHDKRVIQYVLRMYEQIKNKKIQIQKLNDDMMHLKN